MKLNLEKALSSYKDGDVASAEAECRKLLSALKRKTNKPLHAEVYNLLAAIAINDNQIKKAIDYCNKGIRKYRNPHLFNTRAIAWLKAEKYQRALASVETALSIAPNIQEFATNKIEILIHLKRFQEASHLLWQQFGAKEHQVLREKTLARITEAEGQYDRAESHLRQVISLQPHDKRVLFEYQAFAVRRNEIRKAIPIFEKAIAAGLDGAEMLQQVASMYELTSDLESSTDWVRRALDKMPGYPAAEVTQAMLLLRRNDPQAAVKILEQLDLADKHPVKMPMLYKLAEALDKCGEYERAYDIVTEANLLKSSDRAQIRRYLDASQKVLVDQQSKAADLSDRHPDFDRARDKVFLVGFPRSGTSLLGVMLDIHREIHVHHEDTGLSGVVRSGVEAVTARADYNDLSRQSGALPGKIVVDKQPMNLVYVPRILEMYPGAKFIFLLRHPADVCVSCYFQNFLNNVDTVHFLEWSSTIDYYLKVMAVWDEFESDLNPPIHYVRYEQLIDQPADELQQLLEFLGLPWQADMVEDEARRSIDNIRTPSYAQIQDPVNKSAQDRWQHHAARFSDYLPRLDPLLKRYGYAMPETG